MSSLLPSLAVVRHGRGILRGLLVATLVAYFAFGGLVLALRYVVLPRIDDHRGRIEEMASSALGRPVRIGSLEGDWSGLRPRLRLRQLVIPDDAGQPALELAQVDAVLGWSSLALWRPYFHRIELDGPRLVIRREADGQLVVAGLAVAADSSEPGFADWLLGQGSVQVRNARLEWTDAQRGAPTLVLEQVDFLLRNFVGHHRFGLQARPPVALAGLLDLRGDLHGDGVANLEGWRGQVYARVDGADLAGFRPWLDLPYEAVGKGSAQVWGDLQDGEPSVLKADLQLRDAGARLAPELPVLDLVSVSGRVSLARSPVERSVELTGVSLTTRDGVAIEPTDLRVALRQGDHPGGGFRANLLDLASLAKLAVHFPLAPEAVDYLTSFDPAGRIHGVALEWSGSREALSAWKMKAAFEGIGLRALKSFPGVAGLTGEVEGSEARGRIHVHSRDMSVDLPEVFSNPRLELANVRAEGGWERRGGVLSYSLDKAEFDNQDASGQASGTYQPTATGPGLIDLQARLTRANGVAVWRYMPLVVNQRTRDWLQHGIVGGTAHDARLRLKGDLKDFPFVGGRGGQFQVRARIAGARLDYAEGWPAIDGIDGELLFEGASMTITADRGRIFGTQLSGVTATLPDLEATEEMLYIKGRVAGPTQDFLRFVSESPVAEQVNHFTDDMRAEGTGNLALELTMPLQDVDRTKIKGEYRFAGNRLGLLPPLLTLTEASGRIAFTGSSMNIPEARGKLFGEPVQISGQTRADGAVLISASGSLTPAGVRRDLDWPWLANLSGQTGWRTEVVLPGHGPGVSVVVESSLSGLASSLPAPFNKSALDAWPLRVEISPHAGSEGGNRIRASLDGVGGLDVMARGGKEGWQLSRGDIAIGQAVKVPDAGWTLRASLKELDVDAWRRAMGSGEAAAGGGNAVPAGIPGSVSLQAGKLHVAGKTLQDLSLQASARSDGWQGSLKSREAEGDFRWQSKDEGTLTARLTKLVYTSAPKGSVEHAEAEAASTATKSLPALDIAVQQFVFNDKPLGRLGVAARNQGGAWYLDSVSLVNPEGSLNAKAVWKPGRGERTDLDFRIATSDVGKFLGRLGYAQAIRQGVASLNGKVQWAGPPTAIDYPSLSGDMDLQAANGQFSKLEPGVGRLLGVLSLQALPQRITLDFRDVFSEGFAFSRISGSIGVKAGVMRTDNLEIIGPAARVRLSGSADVAQETQDLLVKVQPTLSESVAVGATLVNPVAGVVTYLAQKVLSDPFEKLFSFDYRVTGQWDDPKVAKVSGSPPKAEGAGK